MQHQKFISTIVEVTFKKFIKDTLNCLLYKCKEYNSPSFRPLNSVF